VFRLKNNGRKSRDFSFLERQDQPQAASCIPGDTLQLARSGYSQRAVAASTWRGVFLPREAKQDGAIGSRATRPLPASRLLPAVPREPQAPSSFGWALLLVRNYSRAFLVPCPRGKEETGVGFKPPSDPHRARAGVAACDTPTAPGWGLGAGGGGKARFPTVRPDRKRGLGLTGLRAFTRVFCFVGGEDTSGVFGARARPFSAKAAPAPTLPAAPTARWSVRKSKHLVPCFQ